LSFSASILVEKGEISNWLTNMDEPALFFKALRHFLLISSLGEPQELTNIAKQKVHNSTPNIRISYSMAFSGLSGTS
jgi:hypothetical protein